MKTSESTALIAGCAIVSCALAGAWAWFRAHPDVSVRSELAKLSPLPVTPPAPRPGTGPLPAGRPKPSSDTPAATQPNAPTAQKAPTIAERAAPPANDRKTADRGPRFEVVDIDPKGNVVVAGSGDPHAKVELLAEGQPVGEAQADASGRFVILPPSLPPGHHDLMLRQTVDGGASSMSRQGATVSIPQKGSGSRVTVALGEAPARSTGEGPAPPPVQASPPPPVAKTAPPPPPPPPPAAPGAGPVALVLRPVEVRGGGFFASGSAAPGTHIRIALNGTRIAEIVAGSDGAWSVTLKKGLTGGRYAVRATAVGTDGRVRAQAEAPFDVPVATASTPPIPAPPEKFGPLSAAPSSVAEGPEPPSAPNPSEVPGLGPPPDNPGGSATANPSVADNGPPPAVTTRSDAASTPNPAPAEAKDPTAQSGRESPMVPQPEPAPPQTDAPVPGPAAPPPADTASAPATKPAPAPATKLAPERKTAAAPDAASDPGVAARTPDVSTFAPAVSTLSAPPSQPQRDAAAHAIIDEVSTTLVVPGDNLWNISRSRLGLGRRFIQIYVANRTQIHDPKLIFPGQVFVVPPK